MSADKIPLEKTAGPGFQNGKGENGEPREKNGRYGRNDEDLKEKLLDEDTSERNAGLRSRKQDNQNPFNSKEKISENDKDTLKVQIVDDEADRGCCTKMCNRCEMCCMPCLTKHNPLPGEPTLLQRIRHGLMLPPHGTLATYLQIIIICFQIWAVLIALTQDQGLPGGNFFSLLVLFIACVLGGRITAFIHLPPLLGMLIVGVMLRNIPVIKSIGEDIDGKWSGSLRKLALTVILTRAGLGLDPLKLKKLSFAVFRLAFLPCIAESITGGIVAHFLLDLPWKWSFMLGCILGALSPAVTVPSLVNLLDRKYGVAKGIPTMLLAAGGLDNVMCITGFAVFFGTIFSEGDMAITIVKGPFGALIGVVYGFIMGFILWFLPAKDSDNHVFYRSMLLFGSGMIAVFGSTAIGFSSAGPLGCLTTATVAAYGWRQERKPGETDEIAGVMALAWLIVQHFLFGLIGASVNIANIKSNTAGYGIATLFIGLFVRSIVASLVTMRIGFNIKERIFITVTWLSKATVQAAIGGMALDEAMHNQDPEQIRMGTDVLTIAVLAIIICAPVGATGMAILGPRFLVKGDGNEEQVNEQTRKSTNEDDSRETDAILGDNQKEKDSNTLI